MILFLFDDRDSYKVNEHFEVAGIHFVFFEVGFRYGEICESICIKSDASAMIVVC